MAQDQVIIRRSGHQILDELDPTDIPDLSGTYQPLDAELTAIAGLTSAADKGIQFTGAGTAAVYDLTTAGKALLDDAAASDQRTTLGLGTLATQSGTFSGASSGTNTGDQALPTRASLGLDTFDLPQFLEVNVGHASDTTITRLGPGDLGVEGNRLYHAGGTDVPVTDGGTGASTASGARTNLGLGTAAVAATGDFDAAGAAAAAQAASWPATTAFDATAPTTSALGDAAAAGSAAKAAHRDHVHGREAFGSSAAAVGTSAAGAATTPSRSDHVHATGAGTPSTQAFGDAAATGTGPAAAMTDHKHAMPANPSPVWSAIPQGVSAAINFDWSQMQMVANPGAATRTVAGMLGGPANSGTITSGDDADGAWQLLTTAATSNNEATMYTATMFRRDWGAIASGVFKTPSAFAVGVWEAGFSSAGLGTAAVPATHCAIFRYSTAADGTAFWRTVTNNAGTGTVTATSVAVVASTVYRWVIRLLPSSVEYYLATGDGALALVDTCSATLPTATTPLTIVTRVLTLENVAKAIQWGRYSIVTRP